MFDQYRYLTSTAACQVKMIAQYARLCRRSACVCAGGGKGGGTAVNPGFTAPAGRADDLCLSERVCVCVCARARACAGLAWARVRRMECSASAQFSRR